LTVYFFISFSVLLSSCSASFSVAYICIQRVYEDDDDVTAKTSETAPGAPSTPSTGAAAAETEIMAKFAQAMGASVVALDYFSVPADGGAASTTPGAEGEDEDDADAAGASAKPVALIPAKYVRFICPCSF
jgi:hypothetical protein